LHFSFEGLEKMCAERKCSGV